MLTDFRFQHFCLIWPSVCRSLTVLDLASLQLLGLSHTNKTRFEGASGQLKEGTWRHMKAHKCTWKAINQRRLALRQCLIGSFSISALLFGAYKREKQFQTWHVRTPWHLSQLHAGPLAPRGTYVLPHGLPQVLPARPYCQILPASVVVTVAFSTGVESPQSLCQLS